jgi:hypothetical protein
MKEKVSLVGHVLKILLLVGSVFTAIKTCDNNKDLYKPKTTYVTSSFIHQDKHFAKALTNKIKDFKQANPNDSIQGFIRSILLDVWELGIISTQDESQLNDLETFDNLTLLFTNKDGTELQVLYSVKEGSLNEIKIYKLNQGVFNSVKAHTKMIMWSPKTNHFRPGVSSVVRELRCDTYEYLYSNCLDSISTYPFFEYVETDNCLKDSLVTQ